MDFGDDDVAPVDEGHGLALCESFCVSTLDKDLWPVPHLLHSHVCILQIPKKQDATHLTRPNL